MAGDEEHRWLGYQPVLGNGFIAVCSCGWRSPTQRTAGVAGALLDAHRNQARDSAPQGVNATQACASSSADAASDGGGA